MVLNLGVWFSSLRLPFNPALAEEGFLVVSLFGLDSGKFGNRKLVTARMSLLSLLDEILLKYIFSCDNITTTDLFRLMLSCSRL